MRIMVMFDLPTDSLAEKREYRRFRSFLIKSGFIMLQESIYTKFSLNRSCAELTSKQIRKAAPKNGLVQMLTITEKQFTSMELLAGKIQDTFVDSNCRLIEL